MLLYYTRERNVVRIFVETLLSLFGGCALDPTDLSSLFERSPTKGFIPGKLRGMVRRRTSHFASSSFIEIRLCVRAFTEDFFSFFFWLHISHILNLGRGRSDTQWENIFVGIEVGIAAYRFCSDIVKTFSVCYFMLLKYMCEV